MTHTATDAVRGITDDYMTSEVHHPGYVLIPAARFDMLCEAESWLAGGSDSDTGEGWQPIASAPRDGSWFFIKSDSSHFPYDVAQFNKQAGAFYKYLGGWSDARFWRPADREPST